MGSDIPPQSTHSERFLQYAGQNRPLRVNDGARVQQRRQYQQISRIWAVPKSSKVLLVDIS
jgi:hypothetical protein